MTAWLLTWLWQGSALAARCCGRVRCAPRGTPRRGTSYGVRRFSPWRLARLDSHLRRSSTPATGCGRCRPDLCSFGPRLPHQRRRRHLGGGRAGGSAPSPAGSSRGVRAARSLQPVSGATRVAASTLARGARSGRRAELMICDAVPGATVLGFQRPCIAIPSSLARSAADRRARSSDSSRARPRAAPRRLVAARAGLMFCGLWIHPAALFVSRALNREREMACDEWVVARTGQPKAYARCLAHAAEARMQKKRRPDSRARAPRRPQRAPTACRSPAGDARRRARRVSFGAPAVGDARDGDDVRAPARRAVCRNCGDRVSRQPCAAVDATSLPVGGSQHVTSSQSRRTVAASVRPIRALAPAAPDIPFAPLAPARTGSHLLHPRISGIQRIDRDFTRYWRRVPITRSRSRCALGRAGSLERDYRAEPRDCVRGEENQHWHCQRLHPRRSVAGAELLMRSPVRAIALAVASGSIGAARRRCRRCRPRYPGRSSAGRARAHLQDGGEDPRW